MAVTPETEPWTPAARGRARGRAARPPGLRGRAAGRSSRRSPTTCTRRCSRACGRAGIEQLYAHQAEALEAAWAGPDDRHDRHRVGQVAVLQPADARRALPRRQGARAVPVPDEGAGAGPGARDPRARPRQARAPRDLRRRHAARGAHRDPPQGEPRPHEPRHAARRDPAQPPDRGRTSSRTSRSSWSTRRTSTAASSARTSPTCCGGCGAIAAAYGTAPRFLLASATIANPVELAERLTGLEDVALVDRDGSPHARRAHRDVEPAGDRRGAATAPQRARRGRRRAVRPRHRRRAHDLLHQVAQGGRADGEDRQRPRSPTRRRSSTARSPPTAPATRPSSGASSSTG